MNDLIARYRWVLLGGIGVIIVALVGATFLRLPQPDAVVIATPQPTSTPAPTATPSPIAVYISGAVTNPDVYELPLDSLVRDAIEAAGGGVPDADLNRINLAFRLSDGDHVHVPLIGEDVIPDTAGDSVLPTAEPSGPINVNTADLDELDRLPGVGPAIAQAILDYREANGPFETLEDLLDVNGIGPAKLEGMQDMVVFED